MVWRHIQCRWWLVQARLRSWCNDDQAALQCLRKAIDASLHSASALALSASSLVTAKDHGSLEIDVRSELHELKESAKHSEPNADTYFIAALLLADVKEFTSAVKAYERVLQILPNCTEAQYNLGLAYGGFGDHEKEKHCYRKAIDIDPEYGSAWRNLAVIYADSGDYEAAIPCWRRAVALQNEDPSLWVSLGWALAQVERYRDAIAAYEEAIKRMPEFAVGYFNVALFELKLHDCHAAMKAAQKALSLDPNYADAMTLMGMAHAELGNHELAIEMFDSAIRTSPSILEPYMNKADSLMQLNRKSEARSTLEKALELQPTSPESIFAIGETYSKLREYEVVTKLCERLERIGSPLAAKLVAIIDSKASVGL